MVKVFDFIFRDVAKRSLKSLVSTVRKREIL